MSVFPSTQYEAASAQGALNNQARQLKNLADTAHRLTGGRTTSMKLEKPGPFQLKKVPGSEPADDRKQLREVARNFEAILINQLLKAMRKTIPKSDLLNSFSLEQYESMLDEEIANEMSKQKGIGLADTLFHQLSQLKGVRIPANAAGGPVNLKPAGRYE